MAEKRPLQVGERVAAYGYDDRDNLFDGERVTIVERSADDVYQITHGGKKSRIHRRNLVRLVPKKRREWWVNPTFLVDDPCVNLRDGSLIISSIAPQPGFVHVREVRARSGAGGGEDDNG